jgi:RNA polymerase-binding transcription factor
MTSASLPLPDALTAEFRQRLLDARNALLRTIGLTDEDLETLCAWEPGAPPEHAASETAAALLSKLEGQEKHGLDEIADALLRLEGRTYGLCQSCQRAIPLARLRAMPAARLCLPCQAKTEHRP